MTAERDDGTARDHLRASHADREQAIDALKAAFVQGRLTKDEFSQRADQVFTSRTYADIPEGLRVAVLGTSGVGSELRKVLDAPDPPPASTLIPKRRPKPKPGYTIDDLPPITDVAGYPGIPGHW